MKVYPLARDNLGLLEAKPSPLEDSWPGTRCPEGFKSAFGACESLSGGNEVLLAKHAWPVALRRRAFRAMISLL
jgi:hypothetical protein